MFQKTSDSVSGLKNVPERYVLPHHFNENLVTSILHIMIGIAMLTAQVTMPSQALAAALLAAGRLLTSACFAVGKVFLLVLVLTK